MPKIKMPVKSPHIDMTPMVDLFSLLLTFFMLTTSFRPQEAATISTPNSISEKVAPETDVITVLVDGQNRIFFNMGNSTRDTSSHFRSKLLSSIAGYYKENNLANPNKLNFTDEDLKRFDKLSSFGMPIDKVKDWLNPNLDSKAREKLQTGIPMDSTDNQLSMWIRFARITNKEAVASIKGDSLADFNVVKRVMDILQENKVNKFNLTTNLQKEEVTLKDLDKL